MMLLEHVGCGGYGATTACSLTALYGVTTSVTTAYVYTARALYIV